MGKLTEEDKAKLKEAGREDLIKIHEINESGYAGMMPGTGELVDTRCYSAAIPVQANIIMGIPAPKPVTYLERRMYDLEQVDMEYMNAPAAYRGKNTTNWDFLVFLEDIKTMTDKEWNDRITYLQNTYERRKN